MCGESYCHLCICLCICFAVIGAPGTKVMCQEAGCGCCVVTVTKTDPVTKQATTNAVNSVSSTMHCSNNRITNNLDSSR